MIPYLSTSKAITAMVASVLALTIALPETRATMLAVADSQLGHLGRAIQTMSNAKDHNGKGDNWFIIGCTIATHLIKKPACAELVERKYDDFGPLNKDSREMPGNAGLGVDTDLGNAFVDTSAYDPSFFDSPFELGSDFDKEFEGDLGDFDLGGGGGGGGGRPKEDYKIKTADAE